MKKRYLISTVVYFTLIILFSLSIYAFCSDCFDHTGDGIGDCANGCEAGENINFCNDCTKATCGDGTCDTGLDEEVIGGLNHCPMDCPLPDGEICQENGDCQNFCSCGTCSSTPAPACCINSDCDDSLICTIDTCSAGTCEHTPKSCGVNEQCNPTTGVCECGSSYTDCSGTCYNLDSDVNHCGFCDNPCPLGVSCGSGVCTSNLPPVISTTSPLPDATAGITYLTQIFASDPEGDSITYSISGHSLGMTLNTNTGSFTWGSPVEGTYTGIQIIATDEHGLHSAPVTFTLTVNPSSDCSVLADCGSTGTSCKYFDCVGGSCVLMDASDGTVCTDLNTCTGPDECSGGTCVGPIITEETSCIDGINNDCSIDTLTDCDDPDCSSVHECQMCSPDETQCSGICVNTNVDTGNCGSCGNVCALANTLTHTCTLGTCEIATCNANQWDINQIDLDGCEYSCTQTTGQEATETACDDTFDNDCDGDIDTADTDCAVACSPSGDIQPASCGLGICRNTVTQTCTGGVWVGDCTAGNPQDEICDSLDNDCDGLVDEGCES